MTRERRLSLTGAAALLITLPLVAGAQTAPTEPKVFFACYGSLTGVVYRIKEPGLPTGCLHRTHVQFSWTGGTGGAALTEHGALQGLGNDDHPQYLLVDGSRALTGALNAGGNKLSNLAAATTAGDAVPFEQAVKSGDAAGGDLSGTYPAPTVAKLQNTAVSTTAPANGEVLAFDGSAWRPTAATSAGSGISGWEYVEESNSEPDAGVNFLVATCPAGKNVIGGGFTAEDVRRVVIMSRPDDNTRTSWVVGVYTPEEAAGFGNGTTAAHAFCANVAP